MSTFIGSIFPAVLEAETKRTQQKRDELRELADKHGFSVKFDDVFAYVDGISPGPTCGEPGAILGWIKARLADQPNLTGRKRAEARGFQIGSIKVDITNAQRKQLTAIAKMMEVEGGEILTATCAPTKVIHEFFDRWEKDKKMAEAAKQSILRAGSENAVNWRKQTLSAQDQAQVEASEAFAKAKKAALEPGATLADVARAYGYPTEAEKAIEKARRHLDNTAGAWATCHPFMKDRALEEVVSALVTLAKLTK